MNRIKKILNIFMQMNVKKFRCWSNPNRIYDLEFSENIINLQITVPHNFKLLQILNEDQEELFSKLYTSNSCKCKLNVHEPGVYYLYLYVSNNGTDFVSFIGGKQIILNLDNTNQWYFRIPRYTIWNKKLLESKHLKYVFCDTLLDNDHTMTKVAIRLTKRCSNLREKVLIIHDFVAKNLYYDFDSLSSGESTNRTIEQIVHTRRCVCQGFADLTLVLLKSMGIQVENILCYAIQNIFESGWSYVVNRTSDFNHVITRVKLENRWLFMDVTWDSTNRYENGVYIKGDYVSHRYFDVTLPFLSATHRFFEKK